MSDSLLSRLAASSNGKAVCEEFPAYYIPRLFWKLFSGYSETRSYVFSRYRITSLLKYSSSRSGPSMNLRCLATLEAQSFFTHLALIRCDSTPSQGVQGSGNEVGNKPEQNDGDLQWLSRNGSLMNNATGKSHICAFCTSMCMCLLTSSHPMAPRTADGVGSPNPHLHGVWGIHGIRAGRFKAFHANMD